MGISERGKEIKRRRKRRSKLAHLTKRLEKAPQSERAHIANKLRRMSPGGEVLIARLGLEER